MTIRLQAIHRTPSVRLLALAPIVVAAAAMLTACGDKKADAGKSSQAAARVDSAEVTVHQINQVLERQPGLRPEQAESASRQVLESLIDQQVAVTKAEEQKLDRDPQVVQALDAARRNILARTYLDRAAAAATSTPTADEIRKYFDAKPALFSERKVYVIQEFTVPGKPADTTPVIDKLKATKTPQAFTEVLRASGLKFNTNQVAQPAENLPLNLIDKLAKVGDGEALYITAPDGFKAMLVVASKPQPVTFDQAKPAITQFLTAERRREFIQKEIKNLRAAAKIEYIGKFAQPAASGASAPAPTAPAPASEAAPASAASGLDADAISKGLSGLK